MREGFACTAFPETQKRTILLFLYAASMLHMHAASGFFPEECKLSVCTKKYGLLCPRQSHVVLFLFVSAARRAKRLVHTKLHSIPRTYHLWWRSYAVVPHLSLREFVTDLRKTEPT